jgi:hypothetical protein
MPRTRCRIITIGSLHHLGVIGQTYLHGYGVESLWRFAALISLYGSS